MGTPRSASTKKENSCQLRKGLLVVQCDKNIGPAIIEKERYITLAFSNNLSNEDTYKHLTEDDALQEQVRIKSILEKYIKSNIKYVYKEEKALIKQGLSEDTCFPIFYLIMKVHKDIPSLTRPVISIVAKPQKVQQQH